MNNSFQYIPVQASPHAVSVDRLTLFLLLLSLFFTFLIATLVVYFAIKYRRRAPFQHVTVTQTREQQKHGLALEITWTVIPLILVTIMFFAGARLYVRSQQPPADATDIYVMGKRWMWQLQHPTGPPREIDELHIPAGRALRLIMISEDVIHDFGLPAFRMKQDVLPNRYTSEWFEPTQPGEYHLFCDQYCGTDHSKMVGTIFVMEPAKYRQWLEGRPADVPMRVAGEKLFAQYGCVTCHASRGPTMAGLYGRTVQLEGGGSVLADENYLRESILYPSARIVRGYPPIMPSFRGQLTEDQVLQLIAYIKSLAGATTNPYALQPLGPATQPNRAIPGPGPFQPTLEPKEQP